MLAFRSKTLKRLSSLTLSEYEAENVLALTKKYGVAPITLQRYAMDNFHLARKKIKRKIIERYQHVDWTLNDTSIAIQLVAKKNIKEPAAIKRAIKHTRERVRQVRALLGKSKSPFYGRRNHHSA